MNVKEIKPIGYCFGVIQAITISLKIRKEYPNRPIYVFGLLVHNDAVTKLLEKSNIVTIDTTNIDVTKRLESFSKDDIVIFTAHGHPDYYEEILKNKGITYFDTTCIKVKKNISLIKENISSRQVIYIGTRNHPETNAALSQSDRVLLYDKKEGFDYSKLVCKDPLVINQTTLSFLEIKNIHKDILSHCPSAHIEDEICNATRIRQEGLLKIGDETDLIVIIGSTKSSNTKKLFEVATKSHPGLKVIMVDTLDDIKQYELKKYKNCVVSSGTSTSLETIKEIEDYLKGE